MRAQILLVVIVLTVLGTFAALNWETLAAPAPLHLLVTRVEAPPGLILLTATAVLTVLYLLFVLGLETAALVEARRSGRELLAQRKLADDAEASRFTELRKHLDDELTQLKAAPAEAAQRVVERVGQAEAALRRDIHETGNTIAAYIGEAEDRLTKERPR